MYYPFFRARQFELIALRELAQEGVLRNTIIPILEPVKDAFNNLKLAFSTFEKHQQPSYLILNPTVGSVKGDKDIITNFFFEAHKEFNYIKPALYFKNTTSGYDKNNALYIKNIIRDFELKDCMLLCSNDVDVEDEDFVSLLDLPAISSLTVSDPAKNRSLNRKIKSLEKTYIRIDEPFETEARNSDFLNIQERRFSEEHLFYKDEGFDGFSDYTTLPSEYTEGGSAPRAVVIHLTYLKSDEKIWIRHFTSVSNDSIANVQGKFGEAAGKAVRFCQSEGLNNSAIKELIDYYERQHYPGLGTVKKISIKNHLLVVHHFLTSL